MRAPRSILAGFGDLMTPDSTLLRVRFRARLDLFLTLVISLVAVGLGVGYQIMRHLPQSWREALLGFPPAQD
jgi:transcriptional regulator GlxA family with amidase domain